jgi:hypothetical protein
MALGKEPVTNTQSWILLVEVGVIAVVTLLGVRH